MCTTVKEKKKNLTQTGVVKELCPTLVVETGFITNRIIKARLDFDSV